MAMRQVTVAIASAWIVVSGEAPRNAAQFIDGEFTIPAYQVATYRYRCPKGEAELVVSQKRSDVPVVERISYQGYSFKGVAVRPAADFVQHLRALNSVSPKCLSNDGIELLLSGLDRRQVPAHTLVASVIVDKQGHLSLRP